MSSQQQKAGKKGWGSLISGAVAGLESRLDTILAEENALAAQKASDSQGKPIANGSTSVSRTNSARRSRPASAQARSQTPQPPSKPAAPRPSTESAASDTAAVIAKASPKVGPEEASRNSADLSVATPDIPREEVNDTPEQNDVVTNDDEVEANQTNDATPELPQERFKSPQELQSEIQQLQADYENVELRRQEEVHDYLERIDALQAKLQYLSKEASENARKAAAEEGKEALEKKLAERDERVALLLEEGTGLSKKEVTQLGIIRSLRAERAEQANAIAMLMRKQTLLESTNKDRAHDMSRLEVERKEALTRTKKVNGLENEITSLKDTISKRDGRIGELEQQLRDAAARADEETKQRNAEALDIERATSSSLRDEITKLKSDATSQRDQSRLDQKRTEEQHRTATERSQATEAALRNEISTLEGRLEILRSKSEESTTNNASDASAKLMRQVEVLQRQYSVASENWQGIESSLQSRITALEKERDDSTRHENEARRKAREAGSSSRKLQDQLDEATQRIRIFEHEVAEHRANAESLQKRATDFERRLQEATEKFEREKQSLTASFSARLDDEKAKWAQQAQHHPPESSIFSGSPHLPQQPRRTSTLDLTGLSVRRQDRRSTPNLTTASTPRDPTSRRSSALPPIPSPSITMSPTNDNGHFFGNAASIPPTTPSINMTERETNDDFDNHSSPRRTINDMVSASTAAAGPSVQLVERMSASVRRLETEKAAHKEEMARLSSQRDEARKEMVSLMQEVETKREIDKKAEKLEKELAETQRRYTASLEMLGEKEERVGELEADVQDLKGLYKELVERSVK